MPTRNKGAHSGRISRAQAYASVKSTLQTMTASERLRATKSGQLEDFIFACAVAKAAMGQAAEDTDGQEVDDIVAGFEQAWAEVIGER